MGPKKVLLIDDDIELLRQMGTAFVNAGYSVQAAQDGEVGLAKFQSMGPDLVITDLIMPTREGVETIMSLRKATPAPKIIAISGGYRAGPADFLNLARHVGADEVLAKPFRLAELLTLAGRVLSCANAADAA